jgi:cellobiose phosphorylase
MASHHVKVQLKPGEQKQIIFILGYHENPKDDKFDPSDSQVINKRTAKPIIEKYLKLENANQAFAALRDYWTMLLGKMQVTTPDEHTDRMVNIWNAYQCVVTFNMSRSASYFESGIGRMGCDSESGSARHIHMIPERPAGVFWISRQHS